jgi:hypothetical protein
LIARAAIADSALWARFYFILMGSLVSCLLFILYRFGLFAALT